MPDYSKSKIYMIVSLKGIYIGSTTQSLNRRYQKHISESKNKNKRHCASKDILENSKIILLEDYPCKTRRELLWKEREWVDSMPCINKERPIITEEEKKQKYPKWRKNNNDHYNDYRKQWRKYKASWGYNNYLGTSLNLLDIDTTLFER
jgi:predicted GIY-YIG superfamily endonuclease